MSGKFSFKKEASLYAEYSAVVDQMREIFDAEIPRFFDALRDRTKVHLHSGQVREEVAGTYRSRWIVDDRSKNNRNVPYIYGRQNDPQILSPGVLNLTAETEKEVDKSHRRQLEEEAQSKLRRAKNSRVLLNLA